jgi:4-amino-4-deoxy-L-arabinose transferase-like glycosyltransferase
MTFAGGAKGISLTLKSMNPALQTSRDFARRHGPVLAIVALQAALVAAIGRHAAVSWPRSDAQTYFSQAVMLWQGLFPPDPARPLLYPLYLAQGMKLFGFSAEGLLWMQGLPLCLATLLLYRLANLAAGRRVAIVAAALFAFLPDSLFYGSLLFYREGLTAFLLLAFVNLAELMLSRPRRYAFAVYGGVAAGLLTLMKPEFGSLMLVLALGGLVGGLRTRDFKAHVLPWLLCGLTALAVTVPAVAIDRAVFHEWIFINTYKGFDYYLSYCDQGPEPPALAGRSFEVRDSARYQRAHPTAIKVLFLSPADVPYVERDRRLLSWAGRCIADDPAAAVSKYGHRLQSIAFSPDRAAENEILSGDHGPWSPLALQAARGFALAIDGIALLFILPGAWALRRTRIGRIVLLCLGWFLVFYAGVFYLPRFRIAVWPAWALAAAVGLSEARALWRRDRRWVWAFCAEAVVVAVLFGPRVGPSVSGLFQADGWRRLQAGEGIGSKERRDSLLSLAGSFTESGDWAALNAELGYYIDSRAASLDRSTLVAAGDYFARMDLPSTAAFFYRRALKLYGEDGATRRRLDGLGELATVALTDWQRAGGAPGLSVYTSRLPAPALGRTDLPPLEMSLWGKGRDFDYEPGSREGQYLAPFTYAFRDTTVWVRLPAGTAPTTLRLRYYRRPAPK